jgi:toxin secretion/phage lysis holin
MRFQLSLDNLATPSNGTAVGVGIMLAPYIDFFYGADRQRIFYALIIVIFLDWLSGIRASIKDKTYSSEYGINGVFRTLFILFFPALANLLDQAMNTPGFLFYGVSFGLIYHTWDSVTANSIRAGWGKYIPKSVIDFVSSELEAKSKRAMKKKRG